MKSMTSLLTLVLLSRSALGQSSRDPASRLDESPTTPRTTGALTDTRREVPIVAYAYAVSGTSEGTIGVQAYGLGLAGKGQDATLGGGGTVWGSPVSRLSLIADAQRNVSRDFSPSFAAVVRLFGDGAEGVTLGALGKFKVDGFAAGPQRDEIESEMEVGAMFSYATMGWHLDLNAIAGRGLGGDGETDTEGRLRFGRDVGSWLRFGVDGQTRIRVNGAQSLSNGRTWDFATGLQALGYTGGMFGSITAGPATMGLVTQNIGWTAIIAVGGTT